MYPKQFIILSGLILSCSAGQAQNNTTFDALHFVLNHEVTTTHFPICEAGNDTLILVSDSVLFASPLTGHTCDLTIINIQGKRSFNSMNNHSPLTELYLYRLDHSDKVFRIYLMQSLTHYSIEYVVRKTRKGFRLKEFETGVF